MFVCRHRSRIARGGINDVEPQARLAVETQRTADLAMTIERSATTREKETHAAIDELQPWFDAIATDTGARRLADFIGRSARRPPHATSP